MKSVLSRAVTVPRLTIFVIFCMVSFPSVALTEKEYQAKVEKIKMERIKKIALENNRAKKNPTKKSGIIKLKGKGKLKNNSTSI